MAGIPELFLLLGAIIFLGFIGNYIFNRTKISDVLILFLAGLLIGPIFGFADQQFFLGIVPVFASLALIIILFDGGMHLNFYRVLKELGKASAITFISFVFSVIFVATVLHYVFEWNLLIALLMGAAIGGTSSAIVIPILTKISGSEQTKTLLQLESALTDALVVVVAIAIIQIIVSNTISITGTANAIFGAFAIAAVAGGIAGIAWIRVLKKYSGQQYGYLLTLGILFALYGFVEGIKGNGAISALIFGLMIGNSSEMAKILRMKGKYIIDESFKKYHSELSFFIRTFFFVYIGVIFNINGVSMEFLIVVAAVLIATVAARVAAVNMLTKKGYAPQDRDLMKIMMPRGLAAAVLATFPLSAGITPDKFPEMAFFPEIVLFIVILSNLATTIGVFWYERKYKSSGITREMIKVPKLA